MSLSLVGRLLIAPAVLAASSAAAPVWASSTTLDIKVVASSCANCHGPDGRSTTIIPSLAGRPEAALLEATARLCLGNTTRWYHCREPSGQRLPGRGLEALAHYFSEVSPTPRSAVQGR